MFVKNEIKVFATFLKLIFKAVNPAYPPLASLFATFSSKASNVAEISITGAAPPVEVILFAVPLTLVTVPAPPDAFQVLPS